MIKTVTGDPLLQCTKCQSHVPIEGFGREKDICAQCEEADESLSQQYWREQ